MVDLPSGTVTFLFTDIEGSTRLWELSPQAMSSALARHDATLNYIISQRGGTVVKSRGEGDSFFAVFRKAADALAAATQIQLALQNESWPIETPIQVRMALHSGEVQLRDDDYYGRAVNRCARLRAIAHGGQVVVSRVTAELVWDTLPEGVGLRELGSHRLRDLGRPEVVYQVEHPALPVAFPPLKSLEVGGQGVERESSFVGRTREMEELRGVVAEALAGRGQLVMLVGEPGIGKTRTAEELAAIAREQGARVLWGRCHEGEGAPPYWPWVQLIRSYIEHKDPEHLRAEMGPGAADIAEVVSEVRGKLPDLKAPAELEPEQARFRLFDSAATFLNAAAATQPLVIILDDLHWADRSSLLLLEFLTREIRESRLMLIGTYRNVEVSRRHPLSQSLGTLIRESPFLRVQIGGLNQEDVGRFFEVTTGTMPHPGLVKAVHDRTEGNPLFVGEIVRLLRQEELQGDQEWAIKIPEGVRDVIGRRLNGLSEPCIEVLTTASVIGRDFDFRLLHAVSVRIPEDQLLDVLDETLEAHMIEELPGSIEHYQFTHGLIQETLLHELSSTRRVRLHARIAETLEDLYSDDLEGHSAELAHHFGEAEAVVGSEKLVRYSLLAGQRAMAGYAYEEALSRFQRALTAKGDQPVDAETAAILHGLGRMRAMFFQAHEAWDCLKKAFDFYAEVGDVSRAVAVAEYPIVLTPGDTIVTPVIERALDLVPAESRDAGRLLSRYGFALSWEMGNYAKAEEAFERGLAIARREKDAGLQIEILSTASNADLNALLWRQCLDKNLEAIELARAVGDSGGEARARRWAALAHLTLGELERANTEVKTLSELAERLHNRNWLWWGLQLKAELSRRTGDWEAARESGDRVLAMGHERYLTDAMRAVIECETGEYERGEVHVKRTVEVVQNAPPGPSIENAILTMMLPAIARVTGGVDRLDDAQAASEAILSSRSTTPINAMYARSGSALIAVIQNNAASAADHYAALESHRGVMFPFGVASVDRLLGLLAHTMDKLDDASSHFGDALAFGRRAGYRPELAWSLCDYADMLRKRGGTGDQERAGRLLDESLAMSRQLGMRPLMERVLSRREILQA